MTNTASGTSSAFRVDGNGQPALVDTMPVGSGPTSGPIDMAASRDGTFLYVQLGNDHTVDGFRVNGDGSLTHIGTVAGHPDMEGIVAV